MGYFHSGKHELVFPATKAGLSIQMRQTSQREQGTAPATSRARKDWELFWRIIAGLIVIVIAWLIWVLYQITPRSVVTPLAYQPRASSIGAPQTADRATPADAPPISPTPAVQTGAPELPASQRSAKVAAAELAMDQAQAAARAGAHQSSADFQAAALEKTQEKMLEKEQVTREGLKLSTEIRTPLIEKKGIPGKLEAKPDVTLPDSAVGRARP